MHSFKKKNAIVISASSNIGTAMCLRWRNLGWNIYGTYRTKSKALSELEKIGVKLTYCDLRDTESVIRACHTLRKACSSWDFLIMCPGTQDPIGSFMKCNFKKWKDSIKVNFTNQIMIIHELLSNKRTGSPLGPCVLMFAGGGTNNATVNYSAYTISKIALIKMCELLDAEIPDTRFVILGPGWVKTKIHDSTLKVGRKAGKNYKRTLEMLASDKCTRIEEVLNCCEWIFNSPRRIVSGRNFSVVFDKWGTKELESKLVADSNIYKLRRYGNKLPTKKK